MKSINKLVVFSIFILIFSTIITAQTEDKNKTELNILAEKSIRGVWRINLDESDDTLLKVKEMIQDTFSSNVKKAIDNTTPKVSVFLNPPESLVLAGNDENSITINEGFMDVVKTRTIKTDGKTYFRSIGNSATYSIKATQTDINLEIEIVSPQGNKMRETYTVEDEGGKLTVMLNFEDEKGAEILELRRVYNRTLLDFFNFDSEEFQ